MDTKEVAFTNVGLGVETKQKKITVSCGGFLFFLEIALSWRHFPLMKNYVRIYFALAYMCHI